MDTCAITLIGDGVIGKTSLLMRYAHKIVPDVNVYIPTIFDNYAKDVFIDGYHINLQLWDTAGQEEYDRVRQLAYMRTNVFLVCYAVNNPISLENVVHLWLPEIKSMKLPYMLIGTKMDLSEDVIYSGETCKAMAKKLKANDHMMCSSMTGINVDEVFQRAVRLYIENKHRRKCVIL